MHKGTFFFLYMQVLFVKKELLDFFKQFFSDAFQTIFIFGGFFCRRGHLCPRCFPCPLALPRKVYPTMLCLRGPQSRGGSLATYPDGDYIMPPMPGLGIAGAGFSSFLSTMTHSVVRNMPAMEAAFSSATRVTFAGSTTPAASRCS